MHEHMDIKFINAKQAKETCQYRNIKSKLYQTNGAIWYNKACRLKRCILLVVIWKLCFVFHIYRFKFTLSGTRGSC